MVRIWVLLLLIVPFVLQAQEQSSLPPSAAAGIVAEELQKEFQEPEVPLEKKIPFIELEPPENTLEMPKGAKVLIDNIIVEGCSVGRGINEVIRPYCQCHLTGADIKSLCREIRTHYMKQGYVFTTAYAPQQRIVNRCLRIRVLEGCLGHIAINGNCHYSKSFILSYVCQFIGKPIHYDNFMRALLLLNENMDLCVSAVFKKGQSCGEVDVELVVKDKLPLHVYMDYNNYGSNVSTKHRLGARLEYGNMLFDGDKLSFAEAIGFPADRLKFLNPIYSVVLNGQGTLPFAFEGSPPRNRGIPI